MQNIIRAVYNC